MLTGAPLTLLEQYRKDGNENLSRVVTGDETWVSFVNVETKDQSKHWIHTRSPNKPKKFKQTLSACQKADGNCFLGQERCADVGIHATRDHNNVISLLGNTKKLRSSIKSKRRGMLISGVVLLHVNARPHTAARTRALLDHFNWELFDHPLYSPDLSAPSDFHLLTYLKNWLGSQRLSNNEELAEGVKKWLSSQAADFFHKGIQKLIPRYKCLNSGGDYVEKHLKYVRIFFVYNKIYYLIVCFVNCSPEVTFRISLV
jgi:hypothetical protein